MLDALFRAPVAGAQLPSKITECFGGCGAMVTYRTNSRVYCSSCKIKNKRESARRAAEKQRRKNGIPQVKGATLVCEACENDFVSSSGGRVKWCPGCRPAMGLRRARDYSYEVDKSGTRQRVKGKTLACVDCASEFIADRNRVRCEECTALVRPPHVGETACGDCGVFFPSENRKKRYCEDCASARRADSFRRFARKKFAELSGDAKFDLNTLMRSRMRHSLNGGKRGASWASLVGYTVDELKAHLERQFLPGMTWDNRGINGWHIDHILPISSFDYDSPDHPDFKACWALTNLRPMWGGDNIRKKDKRLFLI